MGTEERIEELRSLRDQALHAGSERAVARQHEQGKLTARERIQLLLDKGSFEEIDMFVRHQAAGFGIEQTRPPGDAVITGWGTIDGRTVFVFAEDFTVFGGSLGRAVSDKICKVMDMALEMGVPVIGLKDSGGARIQEGSGRPRRLRPDLRAERPSLGGHPPDIGDHGAMRRRAVYSPAITDFVFQVEGTSHLFITGPDVIKAVTGEEVSFEELGGAQTHASISGVTLLRSGAGVEAMEEVRVPALVPSPEQLGTGSLLHPHRRGRTGAKTISTRSSPTRPTSLTTWSGRPDCGRRRGVLPGARALGPQHRRGTRQARRLVGGHRGQPAIRPAGTLDIDASEKAARFVRFCDAFNILLLTFVDVPGFLPGVDQEHRGSSGTGQSSSSPTARPRSPGHRHHPQGLRRGYVVMNPRGIRWSTHGPRPRGEGSGAVGGSSEPRSRS